MQFIVTIPDDAIENYGDGWIDAADFIAQMIEEELEAELVTVQRVKG